MEFTEAIALTPAPEFFVWQFSHKNPRTGFTLFWANVIDNEGQVHLTVGPYFDHNVAHGKAVQWAALRGMRLVNEAEVGL